MMNKRYAVALLILLVTGSLFWIGRGRAGQSAPNPGQAVRQSIELTVYSEDFGMVREVRPLQLAKGANKLGLVEVSKQLDPESVLLRWQGSNASNLPQIIAHAYDIGVGSGDQLLKRYVGQPVTLVRYADNGRESERQTGTLMNVNGGGQVVLQSEGNFYVNPPGTIVAPASNRIVTIPQLSIQADSPSVQTAPLEVAYLTRGLSWNSDYVATLSPKNNSLALECWATVTNRTGTDYPDANVTLIAGTPNRAARPAEEYQQQGNMVAGDSAVRFPRHMAALPPAPMAAPNLAGGAPSTVGDFHAYKIARPTTVVQEQMNRLLLLSSKNVPVLRDYSAQPPTLSAWDEGYYGNQSATQHGDVAQAITFWNKPKDGLGAPLPTGTMRVYEPDSSGSLRYAGAAEVQNTPKDQKVNLTLAKAFDVFTEWRLVKSQKLNKHTERKQVELILHNEKAAPVTLRIVQDFGGHWKVIAEPSKHVNLNASRAQWTATLPAGSQVHFAYTVDFTI